MSPLIVRSLKRKNSGERQVHTSREVKPLQKSVIVKKMNLPKTTIYKKSEIKYNKPKSYEIFAYCSKNYQDAFDFVVPSWIRHESVSKVTVYTDWNYKYKNDKVEIIHMFDKRSSDWITGTGRRLDVIKDYSEKNRGTNKNVLFLDIDCYIVKDVAEVFQYDFDIAISRLNSKESHANQTATAGLWFARLTPGYYNFIEDWFSAATEFKSLGIGLKKHLISYVQYSFTKVARANTPRYHVLPIDENVYNSEHTLESKWYDKIKKFNPKILHYKGRRFRDEKMVEKTLKLAEDK